LKVHLGIVMEAAAYHLLFTTSLETLQHLRGRTPTIRFSQNFTPLSGLLETCLCKVWKTFGKDVHMAQLNQHVSVPRAR
jgi:hypothetical protein